MGIFDSGVQAMKDTEIINSKGSFLVKAIIRCIVHCIKTYLRGPDERKRLKTRHLEPILLTNALQYYQRNSTIARPRRGFVMCYFIECNPNMVPSGSSTREINPNSPIENFDF